MKTLITLLTLAFLLGAARAEQEDASQIRPGDPREKVLETLGKPDSRIETPEKSWYYYERGEVYFQDDQVVYVSLMDPEEAEALREERERERAELAERGREVRDAVLADEEFAQMSAADRAAFWEEFRENYPDVNVEVHYQKARIAARRERDLEEAERRIADLESRVVSAEEQARRAELMAETNRYSRVPEYSYTTPVVYIRHSGSRRRLHDLHSFRNRWRTPSWKNQHDRNPWPNARESHEERVRTDGQTLNTSRSLLRGRRD